MAVDGGVTYDYAEFVAPALLAAAAMNGAVFDATGNVFEMLRHTKLYDTVLATPMTPADVALGEMLTAVARGGLYSVAFVVSMWVLGLALILGVLIAVPVGALPAWPPPPQESGSSPGPHRPSCQGTDCLPRAGPRSA